MRLGVFRCVSKCANYEYKYECPYFFERSIDYYPYFRECCQKYTLIGIIKFILYVIFHPFYLLQLLCGYGGEIYARKYETTRNIKNNEDLLFKEIKLNQVTLPQERKIEKKEAVIKKEVEIDEELEVLELIKNEIIQLKKVKNLYPYRHDLISMKEEAIDIFIDELRKIETKKKKGEFSIRRIK
ncbi:MAG: hypothetical protein AB1765_10940 [Candidatus Hydrogenedentota bacterium]